MRQQVILAKFPDRSIAQRAARDLMRNNYPEEDMHIAVDVVTGEALISLTTARGYVEYAMHILQDQGAIHLQRHAPKVVHEPDSASHSSPCGQT